MSFVLWAFTVNGLFLISSSAMAPLPCDRLFTFQILTLTFLYRAQCVPASRRGPPQANHGSMQRQRPQYSALVVYLKLTLRAADATLPRSLPDRRTAGTTNRYDTRKTTKFIWTTARDYRIMKGGGASAGVAPIRRRLLKLRGITTNSS